MVHARDHSLAPVPGPIRRLTDGVSFAIQTTTSDPTGMTRDKRFFLAFIFAALLLLMRSAYSHHSFTAEFVADKTATLDGRITQVWFKNPHVRYIIEIENDAGEAESWDARGSPVVWLARKGWTKDTIKAGDEVSMYGYLGRDGIKMLSIMTITLADGTVLTDKAPE